VSLTLECRDIEGQPLPLLVSPVIPAEFHHGFATRAGGVSPAPYETFNLGLAWGDAREAVMENRRRLRAWLGVERLYLVRQVHGRAVAGVGSAADPVERLAAQEADGLYTNVPGVALGVFVADCVPVLLADPRTGACAAVHAGWRGVVAGVVSSAAQAMEQAYGTRPADLRAAMGPSIGACCFEVGPEVVAAFRTARVPEGGNGVVRERPGAKPHIDLRRALALELEALGVPAAQVDPGGECTKCDPQGRFYSYRRDNTRTGQHLGVIVRR
jgi:polyphenol oxidase